MNSEVANKTRFRAEYVPYADTGRFGKVVVDFLSGHENLRPFYGRRAALTEFEAQMTEKSESYTHRETLVNALKRQYAAAGLKHPGIDTLSKPNTFTVTTGHQICLFGGPLYFFYKIASAVNTCKALAEAYPDKNFVPVFWMATEDHDFEEANHFHVYGKKLEWESGQGGAVGRMKTVDMAEVEEQLRDVLGAGYRSEELLKLFRRAYVESETMADATRLFVHSLFGNLGVVALDGDDPDLKRAALPLFRKELLENGAAKAMRATGEALGEHYSLQVHPRDINLFYLDQELRERIVKEGEDRYGVVNTRLRFTEEELLAELENDPTKFSPNVALRPVYQEHILPNLAYIGGGGELAYWFQLKGVFETYHVPYPIVMLRNSVAFTTPEIERGMESLEVEVRDLLCTEDRALEDALIRKNAAKTLTLDAEWEELEALFGRIKSRMEGVDKLLGRSSDSGLARVERIVRNLEKKMLRAEKKKQEVLIYRLSKIMGVLFPGGGLQERHYGLPLPYLAYGKDWLDGLLEHTDPFGGKFTILRPDSEA